MPGSRSRAASTSPRWPASGSGRPPSGKANFLVHDGLGEDPSVVDEDALWLTTVRSHDQYNTTLYSLSDRYRGVYNQRDVIFLNEQEMERRGLAADDRVDIVTDLDGWHRAGGARLPRGALCVPGRQLRRLLSRDQPAGAALCARSAELHPSSKGVPVRLVKTTAGTGAL